EPISSISAIDLAELHVENGLPVGLSFHGTKIIILPLTDNAIECGEEELNQMALPPNRVGEIVVTGNHVLKQYINNPPAEKRNKIKTGTATWHRTGDAGFRDENGQLFLCGRCNTLIYENTGKLLVPFIWESWLGNLDGVTAGTILEHNGKIIAAAEVKKKTGGKIREQILSKYPFDEIIFLRHIPRDPRHFSRLDYDKLKTML
ncbi:MAG TPA: AMP-dependent synthetase, partial [Bacteroidia bacterium]|nr:AMP-dependent synthetase [Bacteroidia bacterium]